MLYKAFGVGAAFAGFMAFLSTISASVGLSALEGPAVGILASSLHEVTSANTLPLPVVIDIQEDLIHLVHSSLNLSANHMERIACFNIAIDDLVGLVEQDVPDCDKKAEILGLLVDMRRASTKVVLGMAEFTGVLLDSLQRYVCYLALYCALVTY